MNAPPISLKSYHMKASIAFQQLNFFSLYISTTKTSSSPLGRYSMSIINPREPGYWWWKSNLGTWKLPNARRLPQTQEYGNFRA
jgi:hypothetical protein